jgi:hypothetical protein
VTIPVEAPARGRDWTPLNGVPLVDAIDLLYREHIDRLIQWHTQHDAGWGSATDRGNLKRRLGDKWWATLGPAIGMIPPHRVGINDLPPGRDSVWVERHAILRNGYAPLFLELWSGRILVEADGAFQPVMVPVELWRAAAWALYRASPLDSASSQLVAFNSAGDEQPPTYNNPRLIAPRPASAPRAETVATGTRPDPRSKRDEMMRGLDLALQQGNIQSDMMQTALHVAMLDALKIPRKAIFRGFGYDAFRRHCRPWLVEHGLMK